MCHAPTSPQAKLARPYAVPPQETQLILQKKKLQDSRLAARKACRKARSYRRIHAGGLIVAPSLAKAVTDKSLKAAVANARRCYRRAKKVGAALDVASARIAGLQGLAPTTQEESQSYHDGEFQTEIGIAARCWLPPQNFKDEEGHSHQTDHPLLSQLEGRVYDKALLRLEVDPDPTADQLEQLAADLDRAASTHKASLVQTVCQRIEALLQSLAPPQKAPAGTTPSPLQQLREQSQNQISDVQHRLRSAPAVWEQAALVARDGLLKLVARRRAVRFRGWLVVIARNAKSDVERQERARRRREQQAAQDLAADRAFEPPPSLPPVEEEERAEEKERAKEDLWIIVQAWKRLPPLQQRLVCCVWLDQPYAILERIWEVEPLRLLAFLRHPPPVNARREEIARRISLPGQHMAPGTVPAEVTRLSQLLRSHLLSSGLQRWVNFPAKRVTATKAIDGYLSGLDPKKRAIADETWSIADDVLVLIQEPVRSKNSDIARRYDLKVTQVGRIQQQIWRKVLETVAQALTKSP